MAQSNIVQLPRQLRAPCFECGRECSSTEACTTPCGQGPVHRSCLQRHVSNCKNNECWEQPEPEPNQKIAAQEVTRTATSSHLYVKCPLFCGTEVDLTKIKLAKEGRDRLIWNCSSCRDIKKTQVKIAWRHFVCVQCTHTQSKTWLIQHCKSNCPTRKALEEKIRVPVALKVDRMCPTRKALEKKKNTVTLKVDRMLQKAKTSIEGLKKEELMERLTVLRTAWMLDSGLMIQPWCRFSNEIHSQLMSKLHSALEAFAAERDVSIPARFCDDILSAIPEKIHKHKATSGLSVFWNGLKNKELKERLTVLRNAWMLGSARMRQPWCRFSNDKKKQMMSKLHSAFEAFAAERDVNIPAGFCADIVSAIRAKLHEHNTTSGLGFVFKYKHEFYQEVSNFCDNYKERMPSAARAEIESTKFYKTACLVVPGLKSDNYKRIPTTWKTGRQDISTVEGAAYILARKKKPTGQYLLLVSRTELQRVAAKAIQRHSVLITRKRPAQCVIRDSRRASKLSLRK